MQLKRVWYLVGFVLLVWSLTFGLILLVWMFWPKNPSLPQKADAIICLGADMSLMGWERPGPASARRARTCAELQRAGAAPLVVFSGYGHGVSSAADAMARLAKEHGLPSEAIILEPHARSTIQNAAFSLALLPQDTAKIIVVTDAFHIPRVWLTFRALGAPPTALYVAKMKYTTEDKPAARNYFEWMLRESFAIWFNFGRVIVYALAGAAGIDKETRIGWFN
jgi:uncharacterized SAM-binding protein YcdF (DUF218 family)